MAKSVPDGSRNLEPVSRPDPEWVAKVLQALSDPVRLEMVRRLRDGGPNQGCSDLYDNLPKSTASYHFSILRSCGLIEQHDVAGRRLNTLCDDFVEQSAPGLLAAVYGSSVESESE
ncbi:putative ArsR family transcriptional regulator [Gordonia effusa NBRC 100432]|uniref:Putative ArsR family transcriptional regulator n=1 Tax=Gordonia effusa NBRC 100432 TaxID=1077974 RepID=H0QX97_9ACTN|nr:helix-turn-helix transcriptional regulator [Gordonia effusa]GAB17448.1 putative ArsR family transcriptional regulator [Gordonia effusa NBRC 100432]